MNRAGLRKTIKIVKYDRDVNLVTKKRKINYLVFERNYHTTKNFTENLLEIEMKKNIDTYE